MKTLNTLLITALLLIILGVRPAAAQSCDDPYTVGQGETLWSISVKCDVNYVVLVDINYEISEPNLIRPGQVIRLTAETPIDEYLQPVGGPAQPGGLHPRDGVYIVRPGDSLARIAYLYGTWVSELYRMNPGLGGRPVVYPGQAILLPPGVGHQKGWVGLSTLVAASYDQIQVRVVDFPSYAPIQFCLHQVTTDEDEWNYVDEETLCTEQDGYSVMIEGKTDARGKANVVMEVPFWAYDGQTWGVEVSTIGLGKADSTEADSANISIGR